MLNKQDDQYYMGQALILARKAYSLGEVPIGAVVVNGAGVILGRGYNVTQTRHCQSNHAEVRALQQAGRKLKDWRLDTCTLYVTLQPCLMCVGLMSLSRIERLVYGASSPLFGYDLDKENMPALYTKHIKGITRGVLETETAALLKDFFKQKR